MPTLRQDLQALIDAPGSVTKASLVSLLKKQPKETVDNPVDILAFDAGSVFGSEQGAVYVKEKGPGQDGFSRDGSAGTHSAEDIAFPATIFSDGSW